MSVTSGFFNSSNGDRKYTAEQFSALIDNLITDGVFASVGTAFAVSGSGASITIGVGRAWFNSVWVYNDTLLPMAVLSPEMLNDRIDAVVIEINHTESVRAGSIKMVRGTPANTPQWPELTNTDTIHQYPLAYIYRTAGAAEITQADITNMVGTTACPFVTGILQTISVDGLLAQWESEFNNWFSELDATLDGDTATALAGKILDLEGQFQSLAMERAVYMDLNDSSDDDILDSNGNVIRVATRFPEGDGKMIINSVPSVSSDPEEVFEVGDILTTARTDLSDKWALCNGGALPRAEYADLHLAYPEYPVAPETDPVVVYTDSMGVRLGISRWLNGHHLVLEYDADGEAVRLFYSDDGSDWTQVNVFTATNSRDSVRVTDVLYEDGRYLIYGRYVQNSNTRYFSIWHSESLSGPWEHEQISAPSRESDLEPTRLKKLNGYYVMCGYYNKYISGSTYRGTGLIGYSTSITGPWTFKEILSSETSGSGTMVYDVIYDEGKYILIGTVRDSYASKNKKARVVISSCETLSGTWNTNTVCTIQSTDQYSELFFYLSNSLLKNGANYITGLSLNFSMPGSESDIDSSGFYVLTIKSLDGEYEIGTGLPVGPYGSGSPIPGLMQNNDIFIFSGIVADDNSDYYSGIYYGSGASISSPISRGIISTSSTDSSSSCYVSYDPIKKCYVFTYLEYNAQNIYACAIPTDQIILPEIAGSNGSYSYIKVKE